MTNVFISYSRKDKLVAYRISKIIKIMGFNTWIFQEDQNPGAGIDAEIENKIKDSSAMFVLLSKHSINSQKVYEEIECAIRSGVHIIPYRVDLLVDEIEERERTLEYLLSIHSEEIDRDDVDSIRDKLERTLKHIEEGHAQVWTGQKKVEMFTPRERIIIGLFTLLMVVIIALFAFMLIKFASIDRGGGSERIEAIWSTYQRSAAETDLSTVPSKPPPALQP